MYPDFNFKGRIVNETIWSAGVKSRVVEGALVMYPIVVNIEGVETELSLTDAIRLSTGLRAAIDIVRAAEANIKKSDHVVLFGPSGKGMLSAYQKSKLQLGPDEKAALLDPLPDDYFDDIRR